jgi:hypothetical protein
MKNAFFCLLMIFSLSVFAQDQNLLQANIIDGFTRERMSSAYFEKSNLKLNEAVQFVVADDLGMLSVKSSVNRDYYFFRNNQCDVVGEEIKRPVVMKKGTGYALVDFSLFKGDVIEILLYSRDESVVPGSISIRCTGIHQGSKIKDLQLLLQKAFVLEAGQKKRFFDLF